MVTQVSLRRPQPASPPQPLTMSAMLPVRRPPALGAGWPRVQLVYLLSLWPLSPAPLQALLLHPPSRLGVASSLSAFCISGCRVGTSTELPYMVSPCSAINQPPTSSHQNRGASPCLSQSVTKSCDVYLLNLCQSGHLFPPHCQQPGPGHHHFLPGPRWQLPRGHSTSMLISLPTHPLPRNFPKTQM